MISKKVCVIEFFRLKIKANTFGEKSMIVSEYCIFTAVFFTLSDVSAFMSVCVCLCFRKGVIVIRLFNHEFIYELSRFALTRS